MQIVLLLRLVPLLPFNMLNYLLSVTPIGIGEYMMASWLGMMVIVQQILQFFECFSAFSQYFFHLREVHSCLILWSYFLLDQNYYEKLANIFHSENVNKCCWESSSQSLFFTQCNSLLERLPSFGIIEYQLTKAQFYEKDNWLQLGIFFMLVLENPFAHRYWFGA